MTRIRTSGSNCLLLLADRECDAWHREQGIVIRSDLPYTIISDSRQEEEEELDLRLQKLVMEEQEEVDSPVYLSRQESSTASDISTASEGSTRSSNSLSPGPDQVNNLSQHPSCLTEIRAKVADVFETLPLHAQIRQTVESKGFTTFLKTIMFYTSSYYHIITLLKRLVLLVFLVLLVVKACVSTAPRGEGGYS